MPSSQAERLRELAANNRKCVADPPSEFADTFEKDSLISYAEMFESGAAALDRVDALGAENERLRAALEGVPEKARWIVLKAVTDTGNDPRSKIGDWALNAADQLSDDLLSIVLDAGTTPATDAWLESVRTQARREALEEVLGFHRRTDSYSFVGWLKREAAKGAGDARSEG